MNRRFAIISVILVLALAFLGAGLTLAERVQYFYSLPTSSVEPTSVLVTSGLSFSLGEPGTSYRYDSILGTTEEPYLEDQAHFISPYGVGTYSTTLWIADSDAHRALSFENDGSFISQVGKGGVPYAIEGTYLDWITDVAVDSQGHIWLVDGTGHQVVEVNPSGEFVSDLGTIGESGGDNEHFSSPRGIAFDSEGNIFVSDNSNHRIQIFDSTGVYTATIGIGGVAGW